MKNNTIGCITAFFSFFLFFTSAMAQNPLNNKDIERYISTLPKLQSLNLRDQVTDDPTGQSDLPQQDENFTSLKPISDNLEKMRSHPTFKRFSDIVTEAGFDSPAAWAETGDKIMLAYSAYFLINPADEDAPTLNEMKMELDEQLLQIERNQFITPEHKQLILNKIQNSIAMLNDPNYIANENISTIRPYIERLNSYLRNTNDTY